MLYSDGLIEWEDDRDNFFGKNGLIDFLENTGITVKAVENIVTNILSREQHDDISYLFMNFSREFSSVYMIDFRGIEQVLEEFEHLFLEDFQAVFFSRASVFLRMRIERG